MYRVPLDGDVARLVLRERAQGQEEERQDETGDVRFAERTPISVLKKNATVVNGGEGVCNEGPSLARFLL